MIEKKIVNSNEGGFTLIELIMVIIILGILSAAAIPKYYNMKDSAELAAAKGVTAGLRGSLNILYAKYLVNGEDVSDDYDMADIVNNAEISGIDVLDTSSDGYSARIGNSTYIWAFSGKNLPTSSGTISDATTDGS